VIRIGDACVVDLSLHPPEPIGSSPDLAAITSIAELPPYVAEVVNAVAQVVQTSREFATLRGISISKASERFRVARRLGWIVPMDGRYLPPAKAFRTRSIESGSCPIQISAETLELSRAPHRVGRPRGE
jgi:hypothetical protein